MAEPESISPTAARLRPVVIESFVLHHVRSHPGARFREIVDAALAWRRVPRSTTARRLRRLVQSGQLDVSPFHRYTAVDPERVPPRASLEVRWMDVSRLIRPDGGFREISHQEFRVVRGRLDHVELDFETPVRCISWASSVPAQLALIPAQSVPTYVPKLFVKFAKPLLSDSNSWVRLSSTVDGSPWYRMSVRSVRTGRGTLASPDAARESEPVFVPSQGARLRYQFAPNSQLRLQVMLPTRYPIRGAHVRVLFLDDFTRTDESEEARLERIRTDPWGQGGLRQGGSSLALTIPNPLLDRYYEVVWSLPTTARRNRWLSGR